ncbi:killer cell lectin-like receptor subfamily B member 1B allele B isoform X2 [Ranitomeya imitator]|uniref:killer cell lectin-like receptor subfamily B member 1B allele B isoform X2 n=1 Tax=Ranitomeya imitator TaxID=111125 RepID=UPI0037E8EFBA
MLSLSPSTRLDILVISRFNTRPIFLMILVDCWDKPKIWTPFWKVVIVTVLLGTIIIIIRMIEVFSNPHTDIEKYRKQIVKELCTDKTDSSSGCLLCPPDWRLHGDHCYYYSNVTERTWSQSRDDCKMMGADLVFIKSQEQQEIMQRSIRQRGGTYWIGLYRDGDVWRWVDGEHYSGSLIGITVQSQGRCILMTQSEYYQDNCNTARRWICVKKAVRI